VFTFPAKEVDPVAVVSDSNAFVAPTVPPKVDVPLPFAKIKPYGVDPLLSTVEPNEISALVVVRVDVAASTTAPV
jgi:hypothetical protein